LASKDVERLFAILPTFEHQKGIRLFDDLAKDPAESNNVYLQHPDVVARLTALLDRYQQQGYSRAMS